MTQQHAVVAMMNALDKKGFIVLGKPDLGQHRRSGASETRVMMRLPCSTLFCTIGGVSTYLFTDTAGKIKSVAQQRTLDVVPFMQLLEGILATLASAA